MFFRDLLVTSVLGFNKQIGNGTIKELQVKTCPMSCAFCALLTLPTFLSLNM